MGAAKVRGIVSGGQSGVDRAAIEVAARLGLRVYGWCPAGRRAEDGPIDDRYPLRETPSREAAQRTAWNVFDSDATLVLARGSLGEGASMAAALARRLDRPLLVVSGDVGQSAAAIRDWLRDFAYPPLLNVAGPRESADPGVERWASHVLERALLGSEEADDTAEPIVLVTGARGLLGRTLLSLLPPGWRGIGIARRGADGAVDLPAGSDELLVELSNPTDVSEAWSAVRPELVIHTAYGTADGRRDIVEATRNVVRATHESGAALIHVSTDMVFDGESAPYAEDARPAPVHEYGRLKAVAEDLVRDGSAEAAIVRMSLMMSFDPPDPRTAWVLSGLRGEQAVSLFVDELRCPIMVEDAARQIWEIARLPREQRSGTWHLGAPEAMSRYALGLLIASVYRLDGRGLIPASSGAGSEPRPRDLRLKTDRADARLMTRPRPVSAATLRGASGPSE